eukprot:528489-Prymnesium_polylepis.2
MHGWYDTTRRSRIRWSCHTTSGGAAFRGDGRGGHRASESLTKGLEKHTTCTHAKRHETITTTTHT